MKRHRSDDARNNGADPERAQRVEGMSRRDAFRTAAAIAAAPFLLRDAAAAQRPQVVENTGPSQQPILLRGGTIVSMDPKSATSPAVTCSSTARRSSASAIK